MSESREQVNILVVDDRSENLLAIDAILQILAENIICVRSGMEALRTLLHTEVAVILLDVNMPDMDGFETASLIRQRERFKHTPIIFLTAADREIHQLRGYSVGAVDYMLTPVQAEVLRSKVGVFVDLARKNLEITRQTQAIATRAAQLQRLATASVSINLATSLDTILRAITDAAREVVGVHVALTALSLTAPRRLPQRALACASFSDRFESWSGRDLGALSSWVAAMTGELNGPARLSEEQIRGRDPAVAGDGPGLHTLLAAPLTEAKGGQFGVLATSEKLEGEFTEDDEAILVQLAQLGSIAVQNWLYSEAKEANRIKDEFLGTLSHELRTPLHAILGWTQHLRTGGLQPEELAHGLEVIERNVNAQTKLVEDLLDVSRITSGKLGIEKKPLLLATVVEDAIEAHRRAMDAKSIHLEASIHASTHLVFGDPDRLRQVVSNLLSNAVKFTPAGGKIRVDLASRSDVHELRVEDTGEGITLELQPFVFERFRQGDTSSRRTQSGLGLGLAIVRHIVELHGGTVHVESLGAGGGSTFVVRLPLTAVEERDLPVAPPPAEISDRSRLDGLRVLVVDDDEDAREMLGRVLSRAHAEVTAVGSVDAALKAFAAKPPHVVVSELALPEVDGFDLIKSIRSKPPSDGGDSPALALTASAREEDRARAIAAGYQMHAAKPIEAAVLVHAVLELARAASRARGRVDPS